MMTLEQELETLRAKQDESTPASLKEMNELAAEIAYLRDEEKRRSEAKAEISTRLEAKEQRVIELLIENNLTSYRAPAGTLTAKFRFSARLPQGPEKVKFFEFLKSIGRFEEMATIHSNTFNSYVKEQYDLAREAHQEEPKIPGVTEVKTSPTLSFTRTR